MPFGKSKPPKGGATEMAKPHDPIRDMMTNNDIRNADIYDLQMTSKDQIQNVTTTVTKIDKDIQDLQSTIERIGLQIGNNLTLRQKSIEGAKIPDPVENLHLQLANPQEMQNLIKNGRLLGRGGFGSVYEGKYNGQHVALKHITTQSHEANVELVHELKVMHCYPAENIIPLFTYCLDPPCIVGQYMENGTLSSKLLDVNKPLNWSQRANIAVGIARGLHHLHANNIFHGDIKGPNILLDKHLEPKIGDFGTARLLYNLSGNETSKIILPRMPGSPDYLPNWYIEGSKVKVVRTQVDMYSFGMVLLEIMSGKLSGDKKLKDSRNRTLRNYVDTDIIKQTDPPSEYIAPVDETNRSFTITIEEKVDGQVQYSEQSCDWAKLMFDIGRQCTMHNQVPWREPLKDKTPWVTMRENGITAKNIHEHLEDCYSYYVQKEAANVDAIQLVERITTGCLKNQPQDMDIGK